MKPKLRRDKQENGANQFKIGGHVLLDERDPRMATSELITTGATSFTVLNVFPSGTVEVNHYKFGTFKVNITRLRPYVDNRTDSEKEESRLHEPP